MWDGECLLRGTDCVYTYVRVFCPSKFWWKWMWAWVPQADGYLWRHSDPLCCRRPWYYGPKLVPDNIRVWFSGGMLWQGRTEACLNATLFTTTTTRTALGMNRSFGSDKPPITGLSRSVRSHDQGRKCWPPFDNPICLCTSYNTGGRYCNNEPLSSNLVMDFHSNKLRTSSILHSKIICSFRTFIVLISIHTYMNVPCFWRLIIQKEWFISP